MIKIRLISQLLTLLLLAGTALFLALIVPALTQAQGPGIDVEKTPTNQNVLANSTVNFIIKVTNTNVVVLTGFNLSDPQCDSLTGPNDPTLSVGEVQTFTCTINNVIADFTNTATATANDGVGTVQDVDSATVNVIHPEIDVN